MVPSSLHPTLISFGKVINGGGHNFHGYFILFSIFPSEFQYCDVEQNRPPSQELPANNNEELSYLVMRWRHLSLVMKPGQLFLLCYTTSLAHHSVFVKCPVFINFLHCIMDCVHLPRYPLLYNSLLIFTPWGTKTRGEFRLSEMTAQTIDSFWVLSHFPEAVGTDGCLVEWAQTF